MTVPEVEMWTLPPWSRLPRTPMETMNSSKVYRDESSKSVIVLPHRLLPTVEVHRLDSVQMEKSLGRVSHRNQSFETAHSKHRFRPIDGNEASRSSSFDIPRTRSFRKTVARSCSIPSIVWPWPKHNVVLTNISTNIRPRTK